MVETDPFNCLYSTIHEVGHSSYELGIDPDYAFTPLGRGVSMGVHESQSRIYENQMGRGRAFAGWLFQRMGDAFGGLSITDADAFYGTVNRVTPGYIRTAINDDWFDTEGGQKQIARFPKRRLMGEGGLDAMVLFLCSDAAEFVTGSNFVLDDGQTL